MKNWLAVIAVSLTLLVAAGCVAGPNDMVGVPADDGVVAGFWLGVWHGISSPVTFVISLFSDSVHLYEVHNNGGWYNFGFLFGVTAISGGGSGGAAARRRRC